MVLALILLLLIIYPCKPIKVLQSVATILLNDSILGTNVQVLLDNGSSNKFIQPRITSHLKLPIEASPNLKVMVGDGTFLHADNQIREIPLHI